MNKSHLSWKRLYQTTAAGRHTRAVRIGSQLGAWSIVGGGFNHGNGRTPIEAWKDACMSTFGDHHIQAFVQGSYRP